MKTTRRTARELALNVLYQVDASGVPFDEALDTAQEYADISALAVGGVEKITQAREYAAELTRGVREHRSELDTLIARLSEGWPLDRQPAVDRNILRLAIFEIIYIDSVPAIVAVDEAVELAKKYSTAESGKFVNGVLAGYLREQTPEAQEANLDSKDS
ncbi:MAG: transcription antitermination factor NusB [Armatimonadetes bacterium]|jgi:N utilization substance protein B|nr:transcription antitermination factor NusB [Armatimonadota bacterium]